jgi:hypothetical protein
LGAQVDGLGQRFKDMSRRYVGLIPGVGRIAMGAEETVALEHEEIIRMKRRIWTRYRLSPV